MQTNNPMLQRAEFVPATAPMTVDGAVRRSAMLTGVAAVAAIVTYFMAFSGDLSAGLVRASMMVGMFGSLIVGLVITFKQHLAKSLAVPYALLEGLFMGAVSAVYESKFSGLPLTAVAATLVTAFTMFGLYKAGVVRATDKFKSVVISASIALAILFAIQLVMSLVFHGSIPFLFGHGPIAIAFAAFTAILASLNLILDFDMIERFAEYRAPQSYEWFVGTAVLATLVWMYVSFLRLLGLISSSD